MFYNDIVHCTRDGYIDLHENERLHKHKRKISLNCTYSYLVVICEKEVLLRLSQKIPRQESFIYVTTNTHIHMKSVILLMLSNIWRIYV